MKREKLFDSITNLPDDIIERSQNHKFRKNKSRSWWFAATAAVLIICITTVVLLKPEQRPVIRPNTTSAPMVDIPDTDLTSYEIAIAFYPEMAQYPDMTDSSEEAYEKYKDWLDSIKAQRRPYGHSDGLEPFFSSSIKEFLSDSDGENKIYSPINVYMALGMLAELTDGNSRQQILDLLGYRNINALRHQASDIWNANYRDDGISTSILASSLWLNDQINFNSETLETLAETYYASSYQGKMGSPEFNKAFRSWLDQQTGGLLSNQIADLELDADAILALATTIYFRSGWISEFNTAKTEERLFHAKDVDIICDFMNKTFSQETHYYGDSFSAVCNHLENNSMWFILPDEGVSVDDLLQDNQVIDFITARTEWTNQKQLKINFSVPKFDVSSQIDLISGLKNMGITDVFDYAKSDFTPTTNSLDEVYVSKAQHDVRVAIDEEGVTAAAYTAMMTDSGAAPPQDLEEINFILDKPFIFVISGADSVPLFVGVVNQPGV